jgi:hypothetical protein
MASEFKKRLLALKNKWDKARKEKPQNFGSAVEDGVYKARITLAELGESQSSGRMQVTWEATITHGESKGEIVRDYDGMETDQNLFFLQARIARLGKDVPDGDNIDQLEEVLDEITKEKPAVRIRVRTKDDYTHFYINRLLKDGDDEEQEEEEEEPAEEPAEEKDETEEEPEAEAEPEAETENDEVALSIGMRVRFELNGKELEGEIVEIMDDDRARVKTKTGTYKVAVSKLSLVEEEAVEVEEEEEAQPEPKKAKAKGRVVKVK